MLTITFQIFCLKQVVKKLGDCSLALAYYFFLETGTIFAFFHSEGNSPFCKHDRKIIPSILQIDSLQIFNMWILIISWPRALFGLRFLIIFKVSHVENSSFESDLRHFLVRTEGSSQLLLTREHCLVMKSLKI